MNYLRIALLLALASLPLLPQTVVVKHKGGGGGSGTFVQYDHGAGSCCNMTATTSTDTITLTAGNLLVVKTLSGDPRNIITATVTDTMGDTFVQSPLSSTFNTNVFGGQRFEIWYAWNIIGGTGTVTMTVGTTPTYVGISILEYHGGWLSDPIDTGGGGVGNSLVLSSLLANDLIVAFGVCTGTSAPWDTLTDRTGTATYYESVSGVSGGDTRNVSSGNYTVSANSVTGFANTTAVAFKAP